MIGLSVKFSVEMIVKYSKLAYEKDYVTNIH